MLKKAPIILLQFVKLNAPLTFSVTTTQYSMYVREVVIPFGTQKSHYTV